MKQERPPREGLYRARPDTPEMRSEGEERPVIFGHFARFNEWTRIDSVFEGTFMERIAPGAFSKTFKERRSAIRLLFQHGRDPQIGDKPLGTFRELREDDDGAYYEAELFDTSYNADLEPGLRAGAYGASFAFSVVREDFDREPGESDDNPDGIPERTIREAKVFEGGPVTFPAYDGATAGVRCVSLTDQVLIARATGGDPERVRELTKIFQREEVEPAENSPVEAEASEAHSDEGAAEEHSDDERRDQIKPEVPAWTFDSHERKGIFE